MAVMISPAFRPARLQAGLLGAAAAVNGVDIRAVRHVVVLRGAVRNGLQRDAELGAVGHGAVFHEVVCDGHGVIDRDGEAQTLHAGGAVFCGHDADDLPCGVVHRTAGVAGVDGGVDLEHVDAAVGSVGGGNGAVERADHAARHGELHTVSPTAMLSLSPKVTGVTPLASILSRAMSLSSSTPTMVA